MQSHVPSHPCGRKADTVRVHVRGSFHLLPPHCRGSAGKRALTMAPGLRVAGRWAETSGAAAAGQGGPAACRRAVAATQVPCAGHRSSLPGQSPLFADGISQLFFRLPPDTNTFQSRQRQYSPGSSSSLARAGYRQAT